MTWLLDLANALRVLRADVDRPVAWRLGAAAVLVVVGGLVAGLSPLALKGMIDGISSANGGPSTAIPWLAAGYLLALCTGRLLGELRPWLVGAAEQCLYGRLRRRYFAQLVRLPLAFHRDRQSGALVQGLQQAIHGYQIVLFNIVNGIAPVLVEVATVTLVLASLGEPLLVATSTMTAVAYLAVLRLRAREFASSARGVADAGIANHGMLVDGLLNLETIKCFGAQRAVHERFDNANRLLERRWQLFQRERLRAGLVAASVFALSMAASLSVAVQGVLDGTLTAGGFILANVCMLQLARPLETLGTALRDLSQAVEFIRPVIDVLRQPGDEPEDDPGASATVAKPDATGHRAPVEGVDVPTLSLRDVHFAYTGADVVFDGLSLDIAAGRRVAVVGASGAGKTSLIRLLLRLEHPQAGSILLDGRSIDTLPIGDLRKMIAVVPQDTTLFNQSVAFNIAIGRTDASRLEVEHAARVARAHDFIVALPSGYDTVVGERGMKLSGGERQRLAIARAVLRAPRIHVFDEATSMLDSVTETQILRDLRTLSTGATTITIAHRLSTIQDADEIVVIANGRVAERGDHATLLARDGAYAALWREQWRAH